MTSGEKEPSSDIDAPPHVALFALTRRHHALAAADEPMQLKLSQTARRLLPFLKMLTVKRRRQI
jgi:hypothetical protein